MGKAAENTAYKRLGRLTRLGPTELWQVPLLLPESYEDLSEVCESGHELTRELAPIRLTITGHHKAYYDRVPRLVIPVRDAAGEDFSATIFGDTKIWIEQLAEVREATFLATGKEWNGRTQIEIREMVETEWVGRIRPRYPGIKQVITPQTARRSVLTLLPEAIPGAAAFIARELNAPMPIAEVLRQVGASGWTLEQLLLQAHQPHSMRHAQHAQKVLRRVAAIGSLQRMHQAPSQDHANPIHHTSIDQRIAQLPFERLTDDQLMAITTISAAMAASTPTRALCTGEVGSGKTCVAAVLAAATVDVGGRVLVLCPNTLLAKQLFSEMSSYYPDIPMQLVIGETATDAQLDAPILIGTSALLFRDTGTEAFSLVVVDEQQRWSRDQREHHVHPGTHLLEMSATPIPRSLALVRYGRSLVVPMKQTHAEKRFHTHIFVGQDGRRRMFSRLSGNIDRGDIMLVVYPKRDADDASESAPTDLLGKPDAGSTPKAAKGAIDDRHSVAKARERWEAMYPGRVGSLTSSDDETVKTQVLDDLKARRIQACLCTTVIEVGITIPALNLIVIVCPERMGLMQLHQLRGRVARHGGDGHCILYSPDPITPKQQERLEFFAKTTDGFALAEYDMMERGIGDLGAASNRQSGADETFLYGIKMDVRSLDEVAPLVSRWRGALSATA